MSYSSFFKVLGFINSGLVIVALFSGFYLIRVFFEPSVRVKTLEKPNISEDQKDTLSLRSHSIEEYAGLLKDNPFRIKGEFRLLKGQEVKVDETGLSLVGTVSGGDYNYAIVVDSSGKQEIFKKGEDIYGIGRLKAVYKDRIVVKTPSGERTFVIADVIIKEVSSAVPARRPSLSPITSQIIRSSRNSFTIPSDALRQAMENPRDILTHARFIPNIVDGRQEGFIIREIKKGGVYESLGLEDGDILLRINEFPITGPESALQAFTALKGMDRIELDILRQGQRISMTYQIR